MAWVKDGTNYSFYKDGELFDSRAAPITFNTTNSGNTYRIGRATNYFEGNIDDVAIFNRALGSAEIAELASTILGGSEADLVGYWAFDEGDGTTAFDSSPNKGRRNNKTSHLIGPDYQIPDRVPSNRWIANPTGAIGIIILHQLPNNDGTLLNGPTWPPRSVLPEFTGAGSASYAWATARDAVYVVEFEATVTTTEGLRVPSVIDTTTVTIGAGSPIATPGGPYQGGITGGDFSPIQLAGNAPNSIELDTIGVEVTIEEWEWVFDKTIPYNQGLEFDGDDSVAPGALPIDTQNGLALSAWIKPETGNSTILSTTNDIFALGVDANGQPFFQTMTDAAQHTATSPISIVNDGTWHHAVGIYDGGMIHLYLNASLQESVAVDGTIQTDAGQITIGEGFAGRIDDVSIWERALSERERDALREGSLLSDFKLVGYWRFNEGRGTVVGNLKAGSNPSNLIGDPQWVAPNTTRST